MKRWVSAVTGLVLAVSGWTASAKDLPTIDAAISGASAPRMDPRARGQASGARGSRLDSGTGLPTFVWGSRSGVDARFRSALLRMSPEQAARVYLGQLASLYQLTPEVATTASATVQPLFDERGATLVTFRQDVEGLEVFRHALTLAINADRELIAVSGTLSPHASPGTQAGKLRFSLSAPRAIALAYEDLNGQPLDAASLVPQGQAQGPYTSFELSPATVARYTARLVTPARARKVLFPLPDRLVPAWYLELNTGAVGTPESDYYAYVVSAEDGRVLFRNNLTVADAFTYRVWAQSTSPYLPDDGPQGLVGTPHPTGNPDGYQAPFIAPGLVTLRNSPFSTNDPWLPADATETNGNNVDAYVDISGSDGLDDVDFRATTTSTKTFDRVYDVTQEPDATVDQQMAAVTQLFYVNNFLHDWFYDVGFNEAAGNAQADNFGRGGYGNDSLRAEAQDFSGLNNANMATPGDGARPIMQMYLFTPNTARGLTVLAPEAIAGAYEPGTAVGFGPQAFSLTADVALAQDAGGDSSTDGCEALVNEDALVGKIALIDRGNCDFTVKVLNAQNVGAVGVLIANNEPGPAPGLGGVDDAITVPTLSLSQADATLIKGQLPNGPVTVTMYREGGVYRDGALDNAIVAHEWGHYISNRLIADGSGLSNNQGRSMGEGWADFHALLMMVRAEDAQLPGNNHFQGAYGVGGYASSGDGNDGFLFGMRRYPYSTEFNRNPLTFKHITSGVELPSGVPSNPDMAGIDNAEPHSSGEVWASMLWECYTALLRDSPRLTFAQAQQRMKAYLVAGYKLTPPSPTFLEARDALLAAAYAGDPVDFKLFHAAFARRGAGLRAQAPWRGSEDHSQVVESFVTGKDVGLRKVELLEAPGACDGDGVLDNGETGIIRVTLYNTGSDLLSATSATVTTEDEGITLANGGHLSFPPIAPLAEATADLAVMLSGPPEIRTLTFDVSYRDAAQAIPGDQTAELKARVNSDDNQFVSTSDDVEAHIGPWTTPINSELGDSQPWFRYAEAADQHFFHGVNAPKVADIFLVSPDLHVSATEDFSFSFSHRHAFEYGPIDGVLYYFDGGVIEISTDGGQTWADIGAQASPGYNVTLAIGASNPLEGRQAFGAVSPGYPDWNSVTVNLGTAFAGQTVKIRFRVGTDESAAFVGWDLDNFSFSGITNTPFSVLIPEADPCSGNTPPVANAGPDQTVNERSTVTLNGSGTDADNDALTYSWTQTAGPAVTLSSSTAAKPTFTAPEVAGDTVLSFQLTVNDGSAFGTDAVTITVRNVNTAPVANAGPDQTVDERSTVALDGSGTDAENSTLTFRWTQTAGPKATLSSPTAAQPTFTAPEVTATTTLTFQLVVNDGTDDSAADPVVITVRNVNRKPVANAGPDQTVDERTTVTLDGMGSTDPDTGTTLSYAWTQTDGPMVTLSSPTAARPTFAAPEVRAPATLTFQLIVNDGVDSSSADTVTITVRQVNRKPVGNAGPDQTVDERSTVTLEGSGTDVDSDTLTYRWTQMAGPSATLSSTTSANPTFTAPEVTANTQLTFQFVVNDGTEDSDADTVTVTVRQVNRAPVAHAGADRAVSGGATVTLEGSGTDADGDTLTYAWTRTSGPAVALSSATAAQPTFTAPTVAVDTMLTFRLTVSDGGLTASDTVTLTVRPANRAPVAHAGEDQTAEEGLQVRLVGEGSDPDGDTLSFAWTQTAGPTVTLEGETASAVSFTAPDVSSDTVLTFTFTVTDAQGLGSEDSLSVTVKAKTGGGDGGEDGDGGGCGCATDSGAGPIMPLLMLGMVLLSRRRLFPR